MKEFIQQLKEKTPIAGHPYFSSLKDGVFPKESFVRTQLDFYHAVIHFSRPMLALTSRLNSYPQRWIILKNILDEHGYGQLGQTHGSSFLSFMKSLLEVEEIFHVSKPHPCVEVFNLCLNGVCTMEDWRMATAVLGIIEDRFAEISAWIGTSIVSNGWMKADELQHYSLHSDLDVQHSDEFYTMLIDEWNDPASRVQIERGLSVGNHAFLDLYRSLWKAY